ncbi:FkbM family methyltransferase [Oceaniglobus indicus]|uniref:FkbM family methyltransferase n=1 Tax=Oceaniglobus indicus TaxID=2047749 RepID=UPI0013045978|nr:FkbM family methyltransferase [Oceaniglobus indicus]
MIRSWGELRFRLLKSNRLKYRGLVVPIDRDLVPKAVIKQLLRGQYEVPEIEAALALIRPDDRVLELGTGLGVVSALVAQKLTRGKVLTFDGNPNLQPSIKALHRANGITNVTPRHGLVQGGAGAGTATFHLNVNFPEGSIASARGSTETIDVPVESWDAVVEAFRPTVLICDIEGAEVDLLPAVSLDGLRAVVIELHPDVVPADRLAALKKTLGDGGLVARDDLASGTVVAYVRQP